MGGLIATALLGFVFASQGERALLLSRAHTAAFIGALIAAIAGGCALILIRRPSAASGGHA
jgi:TctA family transporter